MKASETRAAACLVCLDEGWVCENHPDKAWGSGDACCGGAGMPCRKCNPSTGKDDPPWTEWKEVIETKDTKQ